jgi:hypothetical protein
MGAYIIGGDYCRLTRQRICLWQHYKAMLTDSTERVFPMPPSSTVGAYVRGNGEPSAKQMNVDTLDDRKEIAKAN